MSDSLVESLREGLAPDAVLVEPEVMESYRYDRASTVVPGKPRAVVRVRSTSDVQFVMKLATSTRTPVVVRGAGTGLSGGATATDGCIVLSTERMRSVEIDPVAMLATVEPGALNAEVKAAARGHGLWYPPDPSSFQICSIGGNLATNAGGLCCVKYGVTTDYVAGLEVVLADGTAVRMGGRTVKDVAGLDLKRLFVGSEGTLGVITSATLRLRPLPPPAMTMVATFPDVLSAGRAVTAIMAELRPSTLEMMDATAVAAVEAVTHMGLDRSVGALLLGQSDSGGVAGEREIELMRDVCQRAGASYAECTSDPDEADQFMAARRVAIPAVERLGSVLIEDVGVPIPRIPDLVSAIARVAEERSTTIAVIGHAGDGNFHPLVTFDRADVEARHRAELAFGEVMEAALALGGTITGEHGVGTLKRPWLGRQLDPAALDLCRRIKETLDPLALLNPGKGL